MKNIVMGVIYTVIIAGALAYFSGCYDTEASTQNPVAVVEESEVSNEFAEVLKETLENAIQEAISGEKTEAVDATSEAEGSFEAERE